ncbi:MAG: tRNA pseudouridine(55) synthase TruB [Chlamydiota bacterium]
MTYSPCIKEGILLVDKECGKTSFQLVSLLRKKSGIRKIGHAGILDPFASGVMILLIGRPFTRQAETLINQDKEYLATVKLGETTDTFDCDGNITATNDTIVPSEPTIADVVGQFQGKTTQIPPMFSAKKVGGQKLYHLARKGIEVERKPIEIKLITTILNYDYPYLKLKIACSKGTYIRTLAHDIGNALGTGAHLTALRRTRCGAFTLKDCIDSKSLAAPSCSYTDHLRRAL